MLLSEISSELQKAGCGIVISRSIPPRAQAIRARSNRRIAMKPTIAAVIEDVATRHHVTVEDIMGRSRFQNVSTARHAAIRAVAKFVNLKFEHRSQVPVWTSVALGELFGLDHTTILYVLGRLNRPK